MFSRHHRKAKLLFALADAVIASCAFAAAYQFRHWLPLERDFHLPLAVNVLLLGACAVLWPAIGYWLQVYERLDSALPSKILRDSFQQSLFGIVGLVLIEFVLRLDLSRAFIGMLAVFSWSFLCLFRLNAGTMVGWIRREFGGERFVLLVGVGDRARQLASSLEKAHVYGIRLIGYLADADGEVAPAQIGAFPVHPVGMLPRLLESHVIDEVIFAVDQQRLAALEEMLLMCDEDGVRTRVAVDLFPHVNSEVYLDRLDHTPLLTFAAAPHDEIRLFGKRIVDVLLAGAGLVLLAPALGMVALLIKVTSPGPAIFRQVRCGLNGRRFVFYKFRSMVDNADQMKESLAHLNEKAIAFKIAKDPRLTGIGRYLRRFSIDELPQLWNVLRGDMSLVGPRPAVPTEVEHYQRWQRRRLRMRPGLTCLWALEGRDALDFETWMRKDMEYIDNWSLALDWKIILRTIPRVLSGRGAN